MRFLTTNKDHFSFRKKLDLPLLMVKFMEFKTGKPILCHQPLHFKQKNNLTLFP